MRVRKGFAYTTFALLSASLLLMLLFSQVYKPADLNSANAERIGEASFFLESIFSDMDRSLSIATRRAFTGATDYVVEEGKPLSDPEENISEILVNGTLEGENFTTSGNASLSEWEGRVSNIASRSGYSVEIFIENYSFQNGGFVIDSSFDISARLQDPTTLASFNSSESADVDVSVKGLEDPMLTLRSVGRYTVTIDRCGFDDPADQVLTGSQNSSSTAYGSLVVRPSDISSVSNSGEKIVAVENPDEYSSSDLNSFEGVIAGQTSSSPGDISTTYVLGTGSLGGLEDNQTAVLDSDEVWRTGFAQMFEESCYVPSSRGPDFLDRLGNRLVNDDSDGIATMIDVADLPPELRQTDSAVGFVYFNSSTYGGLNEIKGVSDEYSWFRLDDYHVDRWGVESLVE